MRQSFKIIIIVIVFWVFFFLLLIWVQRHFLFVLIWSCRSLVWIWDHIVLHLSFLWRRPYFFHCHLLLNWFRRQVLIRGFAQFLLQSRHQIIGLVLWLLGLFAFFFCFFFYLLLIFFCFKVVLEWLLLFLNVLDGLFVKNALLSLSVAVPIVAFLLFLLFLFYLFLFCLLDFAFSQVFPHLLIFFLSLGLFFCFKFFQLNQKVVNIIDPNVFNWSFA